MVMAFFVVCWTGWLAWVLQNSRLSPGFTQASEHSNTKLHSLLPFHLVWALFWYVFMFLCRCKCVCVCTNVEIRGHSSDAAPSFFAFSFLRQGLSDLKLTK